MTPISLEVYITPTIMPTIIVNSTLAIIVNNCNECSSNANCDNTLDNTITCTCKVNFNGNGISCFPSDVGKGFIVYL